MDARLRIVDACLNRAREALRTMEDVARFRLGERELSAGIKAARHDLAAAAGRVPGGATLLASHRDTVGDVGVETKTASEGRRGDLRDVAIAAGKRAGEALRSLEEVAKTLDAAPGLWGEFERLRYRVYDLERRLVLAMGSGRVVQWRLCVLLTESLCRRPWREVAAAVLAGGADCVQIREPDETDGALLKRAMETRRMIDATAAPRPALIVNNRVDVALLCGADGVHLGAGDLPIDAARRLCGDRLLIGASTHDLAEARAAVDSGADYCGVGAMFNTTTKPRAASGVAYLRDYIGAFGHVPHLAIGGITPQNVAQLRSAGVRGVAVSSAVCGAEDPAEVCRQLVAAVSG